jgi:hypothetical protein
MRRQLLIFAIIVAVVFGIGFAVFLWMTSEELKVQPPLPPREDAPPPIVPLKPAENVEVVSVRGRVERRGSGEKEWQAVTPGDRLHKDESVKTAKDASARLKVDEKSEIDLTPRSELTVREISDTVHRFKLERGKIGVDYDVSGARVLKIESEKSDAVAEATAGKFVVQNSAGIVSVATTTGEVKLTAKDKTVAVTAGKTSKVLPGKAPLTVQPIPVSVMLRVAKPKKRIQRKRFTVVRGRTDVGARVRVNDIPALVDLNGRFMVTVPLRNGRNKLVVVTEDVAGNVKTRNLGVIIVDADAPIEHMDIQWGKKEKSG